MVSRRMPLVAILMCWCFAVFVGLAVSPRCAVADDATDGPNALGPQGSSQASKSKPYEPVNLAVLREGKAELRNDPV